MNEKLNSVISNIFKNLALVTIVLLAILIVKEFSQEVKGEQDLYDLGCFYFEEANYERAYDVFDTIIKANKASYNSDKYIEKRFSNIFEMREICEEKIYE